MDAIVYIHPLIKGLANETTANFTLSHRATSSPFVADGEAPRVVLDGEHGAILGRAGYHHHFAKDKYDKELIRAPNGEDNSRTRRK